MIANQCVHGVYAIKSNIPCQILCDNQSMCVSMYLLRCTRWHVGWSFPWTFWISCWNMKITTPVLERQSSCYNKKRCAAPGQLGTWTRNRHNWKGLQQSNYTLVNFESTDVATMSLLELSIPSPSMGGTKKRGARSGLSWSVTLKVLLPLLARIQHSASSFVLTRQQV